MTGSNSHRENIQFFFGRVIFNYSYLIFPKSKTLASLRHAESKHFFGQFLYFKDLLGVSWVWKKLPLMGWLPKPYHWPPRCPFLLADWKALISQRSGRNPIGWGKGTGKSPLFQVLLTKCVCMVWWTLAARTNGLHDITGLMFYEQMLDNDSL